MGAYRRLAPILLMAFACAPSTPSTSQPSEAKLRQAASSQTRATVVPSATDALEKQIPEWLHELGVPGISVAVIEQDRIAWSVAYGRQSPTQPTDRQTLYDVASLSKPVTAEVFLRLVAAGYVTLDEPMAEHWVDPDIADDPRSALLTPRHVLTHRTGFKNWRSMTGGKLRFEHDPGTKHGYSGEGFQYLVRFAERKLGKSYQKLAEEVLFRPAGLSDMGYLFRPWFRNREAWPLDADGVWHEDNVYSYVEGASELHATAESYARFVIHAMTDESLPLALRRQRSTIVENRSASCREEPGMKDVCPPRMGFGLGWKVYHFEGETLIQHTGSNGHGEKSLAVYSPTRKRGLVVLSNGAHGRHIIYKIAQQLDYPAPYIKMSAPSKPVLAKSVEQSRATLRETYTVNTAALDDAIPALIKKHRVAGVGVGVLQKGRLVWTGYYGRQTPEVLVSYRTIFNTASVAKTITAETLIALATDGKIDLDEPVARYVRHPQLSADARYGSLTPRLLMSHRAGLLNWSHSYKDGKLAFDHDPGERFSYSGAGVRLAASYAESKLSTDFEGLARQTVWRSADIDAMSMGRLRDDLLRDIAHPMDGEGEFRAIDAFSYQLRRRAKAGWSAADDLLTPVNEYARLIEWLLVEHRLGGTDEKRARRNKLRTQVLTSLADDKVWRCVSSEKVRCAPRYGHSVGWMVHDYGDHIVVHHGGNDRGENALVYYSPDTQRGAVIFVNGGNGIHVSTRILELLGDEPDLAAHFRQLVDRFYGP